MLNLKYRLKSCDMIEGGKILREKRKEFSLNMILVTYVTIVLNNKKTIQNTIDSVYNQKYSNIEYIIIDGGSIDGTLEILKNNELKIDYFISEADSGIYNALNKAISFARGDLICIVNADDWLFPDSAQKAVALMKDQPKRSVLFSAAVVHDKRRGKHIWTPKCVNMGSYFICANVCHNAMYATRETYKFNGFYDESYRVAGDFEWIMRCLSNNINFIYSNEPLVNYATGGTSSDIEKHGIECLRVAKNRFLFLSEDEVEKLFWCFFDPMKNVGPNINSLPPQNCMDFLKNILSKHPSNFEFLQAITCASMDKLLHPLDLRWSFHILSLLKNVIISLKVALFKFSPFLYRFAKKIRHHNLKI